MQPARPTTDQRAALRGISGEPDNTADERRQQAILKTGALQSAILNSANFCSIATDDRGVIQIFNVGAERMLGYAASEVMNRITPADFSDPQELIARAEALSDEFKTAVAPGFESLVLKASRGIEDIYPLTYRRKDGTHLPAVLSVTALRDDMGAIIGYLLISTDNTARHQVEAERLRLDQALRESNRELQRSKLAAESANQAKSDFLSSMSHELRSPLNAILGFTQLIESGAPAPTPGQKDSIDQILQASWYLLELINEILDLSLIESSKLSLSPEPMLLVEVLDECLAMVEPQADKRRVSLCFSPPGSVLHLQADRTRVKQVFVNLLSNAIKYNRLGGRVDVSCHPVADGRVRISFQDTGEGLSADQLAQLFQPFNRLGQEGGVQEGTGIGLVVCRRLVDLMGGEIGVTSSVGVGSVFWVELSAATGIEMPADIPLTQRSARLDVADGAPRRTVLCVEDNPANLMLVSRLLERRPDMQLISAKDGRRGIELARTAKPDLILMDINLPGISGVTALRILRGDPATAHIPVIAVSANAMPRDVEKGLEAGFFRYLTKPIKVNEFFDTLDLALACAPAVAHLTEGDAP